MAQLEHLLTEIDDPKLRAAIEAEVRELKDRTDFGLVFEQHLPESVLLATATGVRVGEEVRVRTQPESKRRLWVVERDGEDITIRPEEGEVETFPVGDLLVVKRFDEPVYPALTSLGSTRRGGDRAPHVAIESENFHALQLLRFTRAKQFDCIYIDPPYNTGARDWKYNNDFVDENDRYQSSKWLAFMEKRLKFAKELLKPNGVLIITIDENELHHLGVLLERGDLFRDSLRQIVTICINPGGAAGEGMSRVEEYAIFCFLGDARPVQVADDMLVSDAGDAVVHTTAEGVRWEWLMRGGNAWYRASRENLCYPVLLNEEGTRIVRAGQPWIPLVGDDGKEDESARPMEIDGHPVAWPVRKDGKLGIWRVDSAKLNWMNEHGYAYVSRRDESRGSWTIKYLMSGTTGAIASGDIEVLDRDPDNGRVIVRVNEQKLKTARTMWYRGRHTAGGGGGTQMLNALLGERNIFSFPKSVYAVRDCLEVAIGDRPEAQILDFFAGSGTTLHATCLLNSEDGGRRRCMVVTNNEVNEKRAETLNEEGLFVGDEEYERHGIYTAATRPRIEAAVTGKRPSGEAATGTYLGGRNVADGFEENVEYMRIDHLDPETLELGIEVEALGPLLWLAAGGKGEAPAQLPVDQPFVVYEDQGYAVLLDDSAFVAFLDAVRDKDSIEHTYFLTDYDDTFASMSSELPGKATRMVPRDYLKWFRRNSGARR